MSPIKVINHRRKKPSRYFDLNWRQKTALEAKKRSLSSIIFRSDLLKQVQRQLRRRRRRRQLRRRQQRRRQQ